MIVILPVGAWITLYQIDNFFGVPHLSISEDKQLVKGVKTSWNENNRMSLNVELRGIHALYTELC